MVIEYIDDSKPNSSGNVNVSLQNLLSSHNDPMDIDVNELIVEEMMPQIRSKIRPSDLQYDSTIFCTLTVKPKPAVIGTSIHKHKCKFCPKTFSTVARLKSHQLTHSS